MCRDLANVGSVEQMMALLWKGRAERGDETGDVRKGEAGREGEQRVGGNVGGTETWERCGMQDAYGRMDQRMFRMRVWKVDR